MEEAIELYTVGSICSIHGEQEGAIKRVIWGMLLL